MASRSDESFLSLPWEAVNDMLRVEYQLATSAYAAAVGAPNGAVLHNETRKELIDRLVKLYMDYGLASNDLHAEALVTDIERQARHQADRRHKSGPPLGRF